MLLSDVFIVLLLMLFAWLWWPWCVFNKKYHNAQTSPVTSHHMLTQPCSKSATYKMPRRLAAPHFKSKERPKKPKGSETKGVKS